MQDFGSGSMDERRSESMKLLADNAHSSSSDSSVDSDTAVLRRPAANPSPGGSPSSIDPDKFTSMSPSRSSRDSLTKPRRKRSSSASGMAALHDSLKSIISFCDHVADEEEQDDNQGKERNLKEPTNSMPSLEPFESLSISKRDETITSPLRAFHSSRDMQSSASLIRSTSNNVQMERLKYLATLSPAEICKVKQQKFGHQTLAVTNALSSSQIHASLNESTNKAITSPIPQQFLSSISFPNTDLKSRFNHRRASANEIVSEAVKEVGTEDKTD